MEKQDRSFITSLTGDDVVREEEARSKIGGDQSITSMDVTVKTRKHPPIRMTKEKLDHIRHHVRQLVSAEPSSTKREKNLPPRSKSDSAKHGAGRSRSLNASAQSLHWNASRRRKEVDKEDEATTKASDRPKSRSRNNSSPRAKISRSLSKESTRSAKSSNSSSRPTLSSMHQLSTTNRSERRRRSSKQYDRLNKSLSSFLDTQDFLREEDELTHQSPPSLVPLKEDISIDSFSGPSETKEPSDTNKGSVEPFPEIKAEWSDSFKSFDSHPSLAHRCLIIGPVLVEL